METRPTSDKVKEALFSILGDRVVDAKVLDLFAGMGGIGVQAHAQQRLLRRPCRAQTLNELHRGLTAAMAQEARRAGKRKPAAGKAASGKNRPAPGFTGL